MPKIKKETIKHLPQTPTLKIYKYDNSKKYQCSFYVGYSHSTSGSIQKSLRTENKKEAEQKAKELYKNWWLENENKLPKKERSFDQDIAQPYLKTRIIKYRNKGSVVNTGQKEKSQYVRFMKSYFEDVDYLNHDQLLTAVSDIVENLRREGIKDTTISKYTNTISLMFKRAFNNAVIKKLPDLKEVVTLKKVNAVRPSYLNNELNMITKQCQEEFNSTKDNFYLELKDYINLIRSAGFRPGIEPLKIKRHQFNFITDKENPTEPILVFTLFGTKTKPRHQLTCHPFFTKHIFIPEIQKRNPNAKQDDYLLFPNTKDRQQLYERIRKNFTRISSELELYVRNGATRPLYSIRHTFITQRYNQNAPLQVIARHSNNSPEIIQSNYLDESNEMLISEHKKLFGTMKTMKSKDEVRKK